MSIDKSKTDTNYNSNVSKEERERLEQKNIHKDGADDENLRDRKEDVDFTGDGLDVPGSNQASKNKGKSSLKDEENDVYSQGGNNNDLEEDNSADK
jgi:hypothetical protein